jgi:hypothetical protein
MSKNNHSSHLISPPAWSNSNKPKTNSTPSLKKRSFHPMTKMKRTRRVTTKAIKKANTMMKTTRKAKKIKKAMKKRNPRFALITMKHEL